MVLVCSSFPLSSTAKNPCLRPVCHSRASCAHTGPDQHHCTCNHGYSGDGQVCMPIDPCQTQNGGCFASTTRCIYDGPGKVKLVQKSISESEGSEPEPKGIRWKKKWEQNGNVKENPEPKSGLTACSGSRMSSEQKQNI